MSAKLDLLKSENSRLKNVIQRLQDALFDMRPDKSIKSDDVVLRHNDSSRFDANELLYDLLTDDTPFNELTNHTIPSLDTGETLNPYPTNLKFSTVQSLDQTHAQPSAFLISPSSSPKQELRRMETIDIRYPSEKAVQKTLIEKQEKREAHIQNSLKYELWKLRKSIDRIGVYIHRGGRRHRKRLSGSLDGHCCNQLTVSSSTKASQQDLERKPSVKKRRICSKRNITEETENFKSPAPRISKVIDKSPPRSIQALKQHIISLKSQNRQLQHQLRLKQGSRRRSQKEVKKRDCSICKYLTTRGFTSENCPRHKNANM